MVAEANGSTNGRTNALATVPNGALAAPTLLGRTAMKIPIGGRIRAGIKVLTRKAEDVADAKRIYDAGVAAGKGFETIEREIAQKCPDLKNPLAPKNVPHFTVRSEDFPNPEVARQLVSDPLELPVGEAGVAANQRGLCRPLVGLHLEQLVQARGLCRACRSRDGGM